MMHEFLFEVNPQPRRDPGSARFSWGERSFAGDADGLFRT
jgi:hypothetical protein